MYAFVWLKNQDIKTMKEIYDSWHIVKFLCQELNRKESDEIGQILANGNLSEDSITDIKNGCIIFGVGDESNTFFLQKMQKTNRTSLYN